MDRTYIAIDLKSFYASVECADRQLDPLTTNLVVADQSRTDKTIYLAVSPALKACGIPGRPRLFEVVQKVRQVNTQRQRLAPQRRFTGKSAIAPELAAVEQKECSRCSGPGGVVPLRSASRIPQGNTCRMRRKNFCNPVMRA